MQQFDVVVIGTGSAGSSAATELREAGKKVAIVDELPFGGTCSQRGCDPKKVLVGAAEIVARARQMQGKGIDNQPTIDWPSLIKFKKTFTDAIPENTEEKFRELGIAIFHGTASFLSKDTIQVGNEQLKASHFVIATGAKPVTLDIPGEELLIDSTAFMELPELPDQIVMVGGGYIAFEFAHIAARAGAQVTIIHRGKRPLEGFDADMVALLVEATEAIGIKVLIEANVTEIAGITGQLTVTYQQGQKKQHIPAALVIHAAGRAPAMQELGLDKAEVEYEKKGIIVNEYLQSKSNPAVYACGDVSDKGLPLTPLAGHQGRLAATNILQNNTQAFSDDAVPSAVFSLPAMAAVGLTEEQARKTDRQITVNVGKSQDWYSSKRINEPISGYKTLVDKESGLLIGAHLLGDHSDEVINLFAMAIKFRIPVEELRKTLWAYPTRSSDIGYML